MPNPYNPSLPISLSLQHPLHLPLLQQPAFQLALEEVGPTLAAELQMFHARGQLQQLQVVLLGLALQPLQDFHLWPFGGDGWGCLEGGEIFETLSEAV